MNKICLISPPYGWFKSELDPPFSLMYLAAVAEKAGWQAEILDMSNLNMTIPDADIYGVTSSSPQWNETLELSRRLKQEHPESLCIVGGNHISAEPQDAKSSKFDAVILREGELPLKMILADHQKYKDAPSKPLYLQGEPAPIDSIPFPARHLVDWKRYKRGIFWRDKKLASAVGIVTSRGCVHNCVFCGSCVVFGHRTRFRSIPNVVAEMRQIIETMNYHGFNFYDDTFALSRKRVIELCAEFKKLNIVWRCLSRADTVDSELLKVMNESGCKELILGVESGSQKILNNLRKGTTVQQNLKAMKLTKEANIQVKVGIIVGNPGETWESVRETEELLKKCPPDYWVVSTFTPLPGSEVWTHPERFDIKILSRDFTKYAMVGSDLKGKVVVETQAMSKTDIEQARDELIELLSEISPVGNYLLWDKTQKEGRD